MYTIMLIVALITYIFQVSCFIILRIKYPMLSRQYRSPVGIPGAVISLLILNYSHTGLHHRVKLMSIYNIQSCF